MISVFFSSTFRDMQLERNLIQNYAFREAELYAKEKSETISFVDYRWGIDTSQLNEHEAMNKIMAVCKTKIQDCYPYFIALLGENYGSEVDTSSYMCTGITEGKTISVTEYEIVTRLNMGLENIFFFIRKDIEQINPRAEKLRRHIYLKYPDKIHEYSLSDEYSITEFIRKICAIIFRYIDQKSIVSNDTTLYMNYIKSCSEKLIDRPIYFSQLSAAAKNNNCIVLTGLEGIGKKSIIYKYVSANNYHSIGVCADIFHQSYSSSMLFEELLAQLSQLIKNNSFSLKNTSSFEKLKSALAYYDTNIDNTLIIVLEDLDILLGKNWMKKLLNFPFSKWKNIILFCTTSSFSQTDMLDTSMVNITTIPVDFLYKEEKEGLIHALFSRYNKELAQKTTIALCNKKLSGYPFYLSLVTRSMLSLDENDFNGFFSRLSNSSINSSVPGDRIAAMLTYYLESIPDEMNQVYSYIYTFSMTKIDTNISKQIWSLINMTKYGLRENDLKTIFTQYFNINELAFYYVFHHLSDLFKTDYHGRYTLRLIGEVPIEFRHISDDLLINYLETLPSEDVVRYNELPYLYAVKSRMKDVITELCNSMHWTVERYNIFMILLDNFSDCINSSISKMDFSDHETLAQLASLLLNVSQIQYPQDYCERIYKLVSIIATKCIDSDSNDNVAICNMCSIMAFSSNIAKKLNYCDQSADWMYYANQYYSKIQTMEIPEQPVFEHLHKASKLHLQIMQDLSRGRKCLDNQFPEALCLFVLDSIKYNIEKTINILSNTSMEGILLSLLGFNSSIAMYNELMGDFLARQGRTDKALEYYRLAEKLTVPSFNHCVYLTKIGKTFENMSKYPDALQYYNRAYEEYLRLENLSHSDSEKIFSAIPLALCRIANVYFLSGNYKQSYNYYNKACKTLETVHNQINTIESAEDYATCLYKIGELSKISRNWIAEGRSAALKSANIFMYIAFSTSSSEYFEKSILCMDLYKYLNIIYKNDLI